jgi:hypothetical protein
MPRPVPQVTVYQPRWSEEDYRKRPKVFDPDLTLEIIERITNGETLNALSANNRDYPLPGTFLLWLEQEADMKARYVRAKRIQTELLVDGILEDGKAGTWDAATRVKAGQLYAEKTDPGRWGPKATVFTAPEPEPTVVDSDIPHEVKRKVEQMAERMRARRAAEAQKREDAE